MTPTWAAELPNYIQGEDLVVPPGRYFAMGDNRTVSLDGRYWGFVPRANIVGRPLFVYWSFIEPDDQYEKEGVGDKDFVLYPRDPSLLRSDSLAPDVASGPLAWVAYGRVLRHGAGSLWLCWRWRSWLLCCRRWSTSIAINTGLPTASVAALAGRCISLPSGCDCCLCPALSSPIFP